MAARADYCPGRRIWGRMGLQTGCAKSVQFPQPVPVGVRHEVLTTPLEPKPCRGEGRAGQQTHTEDANTASRVRYTD